MEGIKRKEEYTEAEKIAWFNKIYDNAYEQLSKRIESPDEEDDDDNVHYTWEEVMNILGKGVWDIWNNPETFGE